MPAAAGEGAVSSWRPARSPAPFLGAWTLLGPAPRLPSSTTTGSFATTLAVRHLTGGCPLAGGCPGRLHAARRSGRRRRRPRRRRWRWPAAGRRRGLMMAARRSARRSGRPRRWHAWWLLHRQLPRALTRSGETRSGERLRRRSTSGDDDCSASSCCARECAAAASSGGETRGRRACRDVRSDGEPRRQAEGGVPWRHAVARRLRAGSRSCRRPARVAARAAPQPLCVASTGGGGNASTCARATSASTAKLLGSRSGCREVLRRRRRVTVAAGWSSVRLTDARPAPHGEDVGGGLGLPLLRFLSCTSRTLALPGRLLLPGCKAVVTAVQDPVEPHPSRAAHTAAACEGSCAGRHKFGVHLQAAKARGAASHRGA